ncbi:hypothetical protein F0562_033803 [Nyssa sinensis]|uniref:Uncharacterized protein n=1 Tax=Nyssa sinensis TaxID=561372 RepID=A0A5J5AGT5_9ASTE|nr:hypothetical protein F0562_033803 [Nyssa sinensis]
MIPSKKFWRAGMDFVSIRMLFSKAMAIYHLVQSSWLSARTLCKHGLESLVQEHFLRSLEETFEKNGAAKFWRQFDAYSNPVSLEMNEDPIQENGVQQVLCKALEEISLERQYQEKCLLMLVHALQSYKDGMSEESHKSDAERIYLFSKYQLRVSSVLMASLPQHFPEILHWYFKGRLEELKYNYGWRM